MLLGYNQNLGIPARAYNPAGVYAIISHGAGPYYTRIAGNVSSISTVP